LILAAYYNENKILLAVPQNSDIVLNMKVQISARYLATGKK